MTIQKKLLLLLVLISARLQAQVTLALQVPPSGVVQKSQLWNMMLINGSNTAYNVDVTITMLSTADNNPVLTANSKTVTITKGARQLKYTDFAPVTYKYLSPIFNADLRPEGFLPVGRYTVCYTVSNWVGDAPQPLAEECISVEVQPLSPPVLNLPADKDTVDALYPQFTWLPPSPLILMGDLSYDFILAKVLPGQTALQAIQQNLPVYNQSRLKQPFLNLPSSAAALDTGIVYSWNIIARNNGQWVAASDVFTFIRRAGTLKPVEPKTAAYVQMRRGQDAGIITCAGVLNVVYENQAGDTAMAYKVFDLSGSSNDIVYSGVTALEAGLNMIDVDIRKKAKLQKGHTYWLQTVNSRNELWSVKFIYQPE